MDLLHELDTIIDVGIVNAKHDSDVLRRIRKILKQYQWKSADKPPRDTRYVLACGLDYKGRPVITIGQHIGGHWYTSCMTLDDVYHGDAQVTHWMDLPGMP